MGDCVFCQIARKEKPGRIVYEDGELMAFEDINPQAPVHILIIPRKHIASIAELKDEDASLVGRMIAAARDIARQKGIDRKGYRLVLNNGPLAGQTIYHLHLHLLGGRPMRWPPG